MFINKKEKFSIRKFKDGRSDSVKIGTVGLLIGAALVMAAGTQTVEAEMTENSDNTTTISNDKGSVVVETANIENPDEGRNFSTAPTEDGTNTITKTGKVDYKYVTAEGNAVLEENKNQDSGADKTIETKYDVYGKSGEVFKETTGADAQDSDLDAAKENGKKETIEKDGKTYHLIGEPKVETTGDGAGVYSDTTLGDVTAKLTPEGLSNAEGKITYDTVKAGGKAWIVEQTGKGTYGKYVQADSGAITSDDKLKEAFTAGEAAAKNFTAANVTADGGIKEGDYVFVLEKNTYVTVSNDSPQLTAMIPLSPKDNVADDADDPHGEGTGASLDRTYAMVQKFKAAPDTLEGERNKTVVKGYLAYLQEKGLEDNILNFKRYFVVGLEAKTGVKSAIAVDNGDQVDAKGRPTSDVTVDYSGVSESGTTSIDEGHGDFTLNLSSPDAEVETYSYRDEITPLRAYRLASGTTTITYTYAEEKTREIEKKGSVVVNYQTEDGTELKAPYTDTPETVAEVVTEKYYVNADGQEVIVSSTKAPKNIAYNTKENADEKPEKLTDANGNVYYLKADATKTAVNDQEKDAPAETGTVVEGVTKVTYIYEKAGSVIVNYKTEDGTALTGTVVGDESKTVESGAKDVDNGKPGTAYNTADNGMKPERIKTAEGKVYQLVPESTEGEETGEVVAGETKEVTYVYKEVKGNVVVKYEDTEGNSLADDEQDETDASLNVKYDTADHKKESITKDGVKYYLTAKELKDGSKSATGDVVEGTTTVTYVYEKAGSVVVHYTDQEGNPISGTDPEGNNVPETNNDTTDGRAGSDYNTADNGMKPTRIKTAEGKVYELVPASTKGDETGTVESGQTKEVTYVYKEVKGNVVVKYEDTEGNVIAEDEKDETDASLNVKYDTADHKKAEITKDGVKYYLTAKELKDDSKPATGDVVEGTTTVTYVYEKAGQVVVNYQTEDGTPIVGVDAAGANVASGAKDTVDGRPGSAYDTSDNGMKPNRITTAEGKVYELVPTATKGAETGTVVAGETKEVTYVYKEVTGDVVVHYVDTEGNTIASDKDDLKGASLSEKYDTAVDNKPEKITAEDGTVYYITKAGLKAGSKPETGNVVEGKTDVTYVYEKAGSVIVNYQTEDGTPLVGTADGKDIASGAKDTDNGKPGSEYNTADNGMKPTRITTAEGKVYELVPASTKGDETGTVESGQTKEVTYVYKEVKGNVVVKYEDTEGNTLAEDEKDETDASLNVKYDTADHKKAEITKDGVKYYLTAKELKDGSKPATGDVVEGTTTVTYVYEKAGQVVVNYQTEDGTPLVGVDAAGANVASGAKDTVDGKPGSDYDTSDNGMKPTRITTAEGKVYELVPTATKGDETGKVVAGETKEVTYVYKEVTGDVVVHYVDTEGNVIADDKEDTKGASLNAKYDTTDNKPEKIEKDGTVYYLTEKAVKDDSKPENGDVVEGKTEVTYVYEKAGQVVVHYTDEAGNTIAEDVKDTTDGSVSSAYDTTDNKPATITTKDGKLYVLVPTSTKGDENGKVTEGTTEVTYVYKDVKEEASKEIDKALSEKESKIKENPELTNEEKEKAIEEAKKTAEQAKKALEEAKTPEDVEKSTTKAKEDVEKSPVTPEDKPKAKEEIDKALEEKVKKIDENPNLTPEQKEKAKEEAKKDAEEAKKAIDKAPSKEEVEKAKENGKKEVEKDTPTPDQPSTPSNPSTDNPTNPSEGYKDKPYTPSPEDKAKAKETVEKELEEKIKNIDKDPNLTPEQKEKAKEEARKEAEKVKKSIEEGKTTEWVDEKGNPIKPVTPGTYPAGSTPNYELVGTVTNPETGKVTHIFKPVTNEAKTTVWVDVNGKPLKPSAPGTEEAGKVPNYKLVGTTVDPTTGNVIHVFTPTPVVNKVTEWVDTEGNVLKPKEEGVKDPGKVPSYKLVGTVTNPETGKVTHIFKPTTSDQPSTVWVDVNGNPLKPTVPGTEEAGTVPKYKLVRTVTNPETGDVIHVFTPVPVVNKVTEWVDTEGNVIRPKEEGSKDPGKVPNYELVGTVKDPETGKVTHIFKPSTKKQVTVWVDINGKPLKPLAEGSNPAGEVPGYELVGTKVDPATGNLLHVFKPKGSATPGTPGTPGENPGTPGTNPGMPGQNPGTPGQNPATPANPTAPAAPATPTMPSAPVNGEAPQVPAAPSEAKGQAELPNTGTEDHASLAALGLLGVLSGFGLVARKKKED